MRKILILILLPLFIKSQVNNEFSHKKNITKSSQSNNTLIQQNISNRIQNASNHNNKRFENNNVFKIAFGSCGNQNQESPILDNVLNHQPDLFVFLEENIYADSRDIYKLNNKYEILAQKESFIRLKNNIPIIATWDNHDYGRNDTEENLNYNEKSKEKFLNFFNVPETSSRRERKGIYGVYHYKIQFVEIQVILLDERTFRDDLVKYEGEFKNDKRYDFYNQDYAPNLDSNSTILGVEQWLWLEKELNNPADVRIICSATQFGIEWNGYQSWANFPFEQRKMLNIIEKTKANGVIFISGDGHYSEISKIDTENYPIYDFTSSGSSSTWKFATPNKNRIEGPIMENHFGLITIRGGNKKTQLLMETWDRNENQRIEFSVKLDELRFID